MALQFFNVLTLPVTLFGTQLAVVIDCAAALSEYGSFLAIVS